MINYFRQLCHIDKEIGFCEARIEKERRLRLQIQYVSDQIESMEQMMKDMANKAILSHITHSEISHDAFLATGLLKILNDDRDIFVQEREHLSATIMSFAGYDVKCDFLEKNKQHIIKSLTSQQSRKLVMANNQFKNTEKRWNSLTEDLGNINEGIFFMERGLEYLRSCRAFLVSAKGEYNPDHWISNDLSHIFVHSDIGRAKEMANGADRNLKMAQKEFACVMHIKIFSHQFREALVPFLKAIYEDIYINRKLLNSIKVVEKISKENLGLVKKLKRQRMNLFSSIERIENIRHAMFLELASGQ